MEKLELVRKTWAFCKEHRNEFLGAGCLVTAIALIALATFQIHIVSVKINWVVWKPQVLPAMSYAKMAMIGVGILAGGGAAGAAIFFIKQALTKRLEKQEKIKEFLAKPISRELSFLYYAVILSGLIAGSALAAYGIYHLASLKQVFDLNTQHHFYLVGYLAQGSTIPWALTSVAGGVALAMFSLMEILKRIGVRS